MGSSLVLVWKEVLVFCKCRQDRYYIPAFSICLRLFICFVLFLFFFFFSFWNECLQKFLRLFWISEFFFTHLVSFSQERCLCDCSRNRTHDHLVHKRTRLECIWHDKNTRSNTVFSFRGINLNISLVIVRNVTPVNCSFSC